MPSQKPIWVADINKNNAIKIFRYLEKKFGFKTREEQRQTKINAKYREIIEKQKKSLEGKTRLFRKVLESYHKAARDRDTHKQELEVNKAVISAQAFELNILRHDTGTLEKLLNHEQTHVKALNEQIARDKKELDTLKKVSDALLSRCNETEKFVDKLNDDVKTQFSQYKRLTRKCEFYENRLKVLNKYKEWFREPELTMVCNIIANGKITHDNLPPTNAPVTKTPPWKCDRYYESQKPLKSQKPL